MRSRFAAGSWRAYRDGWRDTPTAGAWNPALIHPYAWYDAHLSATSSQINDSSANARDPLTFAAGSNSPTLLPYSGVSYVDLPGAASNVVRVTSTALYSGATELDFRVAVQLADWTPSSSMVLGSHGTSSAASATWAVILLTGGGVRVSVSDGATFTDTNSSATGITDGTLGLIRVTWRSSDGRTQVFKKTPAAADAMAELRLNTGWTQIGTDLTNRTAAMPATTGGLGALSYGNASSPSAADLYGAWYATAIDGTVATEFDPAASSQTGYTSGGLAWTVGRGTTGRKTVVFGPAANATRGVALFGADDHAVMPAAAMPSLGTNGTGTIVVVKRSWATIATGDRMLDSRADTTTTTLGVAMHHDATTASSFRVGAGDGTNTAGSTLTSANVSGTRTVYGMLISSTQLQPFRNNSFGAAVTRPALTIDTGGVVQIGRNANGTEYSDMELSAVLTFDRVLTSDELALLCTYYGAGV